ncbi:exodeoxyribonuclease VII large subunit [Methanomicrobiaceae archaeon CYW5]|uniref:exodeoxyribonuclease VII large subunit n=1 Tax=Methanovulcanius yangii TaxID=1789227 RepID=UPI0029CA32B4|nr:exodeoxyribonuclease VII large subunit [Methanovulcanius yangii]MBT8507138.1 exodeoxyribonuclease VII large subunit [Methanovulcanius yangii]
MDWFDSRETSCPVYSVDQISAVIRDLLDDRRLRDVWISGEVTNCTNHRSGHLYFSLSGSADTSRRPSLIRCAVWKSYARELEFLPANGMQVLAYGSVDLYEPNGEYKFIVRDMRPAGEGDKHLMVERWKAALDKEGVFDLDRKKPLPQFPASVGVVTADTGAARRDIERVIARRYPLPVLLAPCRVQGEGAHTEIAAAVRALDGRVDVIIVGRGGGSFEDLFEFNHPDVVRAVAACQTPVVSAVGHEVDTTLVDYAADVRAATPSVAAELVVPDRIEMMRGLEEIHERLRRSVDRTIVREHEGLVYLCLRLRPDRLRKRINFEQQGLAEMTDRLNRGYQRIIERQKVELANLSGLLRAAHPLLPLERGYTMVRDNNRLISSAHDVSTGDEIMVFWHDGSAKTKVMEMRYDDKL